MAGAHCEQRHTRVNAHFHNRSSRRESGTRPSAQAPEWGPLPMAPGCGIATQVREGHTVCAQLAGRSYAKGAHPWTQGPVVLSELFTVTGWAAGRPLAGRAFSEGRHHTADALRRGGRAFGMGRAAGTDGAQFRGQFWRWSTSSQHQEDAGAARPGNRIAPGPAVGVSLAGQFFGPMSVYRSNHI